ncbi:hypothetical protein AVEN_87034-1 [Araneus ventricosus]|uniref:Uncharacterized protein n=1 Tax=Araneus ventricosus TaxID=182803 RepID=A0A4Y2IS98_ARAVE|nr:hypothetical protein AVEN_87034-1 [Araneus ventricosus]
MAALKNTWAAIDVRSVIRSLRLKKTSPAEIHRQIVEVYRESVISRTKLCKHDFLSQKQVCRTVEHVHHRDIGTPSLQPGSRTK